jgi:hypothetical protein
MWLRKDKTPYYVGKGCGLRAFNSTRGHRAPKDRARIVIFPQPNETAAFVSERALVAMYGRKDIKSGILINRTDGGDGTSGAKHSPESCARHSQVRMGFRFSKKARQKMSVSHMGYQHTPEQKEKNRISHLGKTYRKRKPISEELREVRRLSWLGRQHSPESREKMKNTARAREEAKFLKTVAWG